MLGFITFISGIIFVALVCNAMIHTFIGVCKIILGTILVGLSYILDGIKWLHIEIYYLWYCATVK